MLPALQIAWTMEYSTFHEVQDLTDDLREPTKEQLSRLKHIAGRIPALVRCHHKERGAVSFVACDLSAPFACRLPSPAVRSQQLIANNRKGGPTGSGFYAQQESAT